MPDPDSDTADAHTATLPARAEGSDPAQTATLPARPGAVAPATSSERAAAVDIHSPAQDLDDLPTIDPDTYVFGGYFARGGMGRIATVRDKRLGRVIAIKELIAKDPAYVARFHREIRITAQLQHPSIVSLLEAGQWTSGEPFFAMKKVQGKSLKEVIEERPTLDDRLGLLASTISIVDALAYAHDRGIIHRDLKPANVLVGDFGETVVIDWGLAKDLRASDDDATDAPMPSARAVDSQMTAAGSIMGTPSFMAPEQARGEEADERSDVYALGAILYTVLTGKPPYHGSDAAEVMQRVLAEDPRPISELEPGVPVDLQTIVVRAMARDRAKRYPSAKELASDLKRFQTGQLVAAHRYTRGELLKRWLRRHRGAVVVASVAVLALAGLGAASFTRIVRERDRARVAELDARARADALVLAQARTTVATDPIGALAGLRELSLVSPHWPAARLVAADAVARGLPHRVWEPGEIGELEVSPDATLIAYARGPELRVRDIATGVERSLGRHGGDINDIEFSRDGKRLVTGSQDNTAGVWTLDGAPPRWLRGHAGFVTGVDFAVDDTVILTTGLDQTTRVWPLAGGDARVVPGWLRSRELSGDGRWLVAVDTQRGAAIWNVVTGKRDVELGERCAAFVPGTAEAVIAGDKQIVVRNMATGVETKLGDLTDRCTELVVMRDGTVVLGTITGAVLVGDTKQTRPSSIYRGMTEPVAGIEVRADGAWIAVWGNRDSAVHLIDPRTHTGQVLAGSRGQAMFSSDDRLFAFDSKRRLLAWSTTPGARVFGANPATRSMALSRDGTFLAAGGERTGLRLVDLGSRKTTDLTGMTSAVHHVAFSPNGALLAALGEDHRARLFERASGKSVELPGRGQSMLAFSPDGNHFAAIGERDDVSLWSVATGELRSLAGHGDNVFAIAFSPQSNVLAAGGGDGTLRLWEIASATPRVLGSHGAPVRALAFSPDGSQLAAVDEASGVRIWPVRGGGPRMLTGHTGWVLSVDFDRTGRWLATAGTDKTVRVWDVTTGAVRVLGSHASEVLEVSFSPDGQTLASAAYDGTVRLWDLASGAHRVLEGHTKWIWDLSWFADGTRLATLSHDGTARVWTDDLPRDPKRLRDWLAGASK
jgi:eukaryotic-like serine/threonine-protein kinase